MMAEEQVSFETDEEAMDFLRERDVSPREFAKAAFCTYLARLKAHEAGETSETAPRLPRSIEEMVQRDPDEG